MVLPVLLPRLTSRIPSTGVTRSYRTGVRHPPCVFKTTQHDTMNSSPRVCGSVGIGPRQKRKVEVIRVTFINNYLELRTLSSEGSWRGDGAGALSSKVHRCTRRVPHLFLSSFDPPSCPSRPSSILRSFSNINQKKVII